MTAMNPSQWPQDDVAHYLNLTRTGRHYAPMTGESRRAIVIGSTGPFAQYCGSRALQAGGNAVDATVATAIAQVTLAAGSWVSMAGIAGMVVYDPKTGETHSINGPYKSFRKETEPLTIPAAPTPSGRTALVPGFFASLLAAQERFGVLSRADVLAPAIWLAENGIPVNDILLATMPGRKAALERLAETRENFFPNGEDVFREGGWFRQPRLAGTLRQVARDGADYIYRGEWAKQFVRQVAADGGKAELSDLAEYEPVWSKPLRARAYGHEICSLSAPEVGGCALIEGLRLLEALGTKDPIRDGDSLYWMTQVTLQTGGLRSVSQEERISDAAIARVAAAMRSHGSAVPPSAFKQGTHSDYVVVADHNGMMVALCHSINAMMWGGTGINVGGISIPDSASFQQAQLATVEPGGYLPNVTNPNIVFKDGKPVLASSSIGSGLVQTTLQCVHAFLGLGMGVQEIVKRPLLHGSTLQAGNSVTSGGGSDRGRNFADIMKQHAELAQRAAQECSDPEDIAMWVMAHMALSIETGVAPEVIANARRRGARIEEMAIENPLLSRGYWGAISRDPDTGHLLGARTAGASGQVIGL